MTAAKALKLVSIDDYLAGELVSPIRHEYSGGYIYAMAGARVAHNRVAMNLLAALHAHLRGQPCEAFNSDMKVRVQFPSHTRFYYPDGMVVCDSNDPDASFQDRPVVIAEVVSEATRRTDENEKRDAYLTIPTLAAYMLIETDRPRVVIHRRKDQGFATEVYEGLESTLALDSIRCELPLRELYERVDFSETVPTEEEV